MNQPTAEDVAAALKTLTAAGATIVMNQPHYSLGSASQQLDCGKTWIREHLEEFPNAWRMPGGEMRIPERDVIDAKRRVQLGELRIPARDIEALAKRNRLSNSEQKAA